MLDPFRWLRSTETYDLPSPAAKLAGTLSHTDRLLGATHAGDDSYPDCVRYHPENNSTLFAVTNDEGEVVAVHEVFLDGKAREIGRRTTGAPEEGFVRFRGAGPAMIVRDDPEEGMRLWADTGKEVWVDVTGIRESANASS